MDKRSILFVLLLGATFYVMQVFFPTKLPVEKVIKQEIEQAQVQTTLPAAPTIQTGGENFYVLENDYVQLVFSNKGGSLAEINLPFKSKENEESVINEIQNDKTIKNVYPENAMFPQNPYYVSTSNGTQLVQNGKLGGYYPLLRRSIKGSNKEILPYYYAINIVDDKSDLENLNFEIRRFEKNLIEFELVQSNRRILKTFVLSNDAPYCFDLSLKVEGDNKNLWLTSGVPEVELISNNFDPAIKLRTSRTQKSIVDKVSLPKTANTVSSIYLDWISNSNGFFGLIMDSKLEASIGYRTQKIDGSTVPTRLSIIDPQYKLYPAEKYPGYETFLPIKATSNPVQYRVFAGPYAKPVLSRIDEIYTNNITGYSPDYIGAQSIHGFLSFITDPFAKLMFALMQLFYKVTHSWGISIILVTIALRLMMYPLNSWSIKSQLKMQEMAPKLQVIQEKYKKNPQKAKLEQMAAYKESGVNPFMGCFPMLLQFPFLIAMFNLLRSAFELRGDVFIPGWINNLSAPDILFQWNYPLMFIGTEFHLLPILLGITMFVQSKLTAKTKQTGPASDQQKQQKMMGNVMTIVFTVIFYKMPAGLNIYFLFSTLFGIAQQYYMSKSMQKKSLSVVKSK